MDLSGYQSFPENRRTSGKAECGRTESDDPAPCVFDGGIQRGIHREMRKHVAWYTQGMPDSAKLRAKINMVETYDALAAMVQAL